MEPQILSNYDPGYHNADLTKTNSRLGKEASFKDLSYILIIPAFGQVPTKAVASWMNMMSPPNGRPGRLFALGMEVGDAYSTCIQNILNTPGLQDYKYIITLEHDNIPPHDAIPRVLEKMEEHPEFAAIGGLYFTKGEGGCAQIWGDPKSFPINFRPQIPDANGGLVECNGTGMGFTCFRLSMFKDEKLRRPWFKTTCSATEGSFTQDLYFWVDAKKHGYRCAIDCSIKVGHYDLKGDFVW